MSHPVHVSNAFMTLTKAAVKEDKAINCCKLLQTFHTRQFLLLQTENCLSPSSPNIIFTLLGTTNLWKRLPLVTGNCIRSMNLAPAHQLCCTFFMVKACQLHIMAQFWSNYFCGFILSGITEQNENVVLYCSFHNQWWWKSDIYSLILHYWRFESHKIWKTLVTTVSKREKDLFLSFFLSLTSFHELII